jgi:cyclic dehypoxanthinyl futalosine synthase
MTGSGGGTNGSPSIRAIEEKVLAGERITAEEGLFLLDHADLTTLSCLADSVRWSKHPERLVSYVIDRNINYTNFCNAFCTFCAFYRAPRHEEGYVLPYETIAEKVRELQATGGHQVLLQGGHNPDLRIEWYEDLFRRLKSDFPTLWLHALSPPEIVHIYKSSRIPLAEAVARLKAAGLDSIPGGGAEILVDSVRTRLATNKCSTGEWLGVMEEAHRQGLRSTATMMFGHIETRAERVEHLARVRELQDRTGGFTAFICWTFQPGNTELAEAANASGREPLAEATSAEYLRTLAVSRVFLDNIDNVQSSWVTQGPRIGIVSLSFGANDMGSTMFEENVVSAAGTTHSMNEAEIARAVRAAGFTPVRRNMQYELLGEPLTA